MIDPRIRLLYYLSLRKGLNDDQEAFDIYMQLDARNQTTFIQRDIEWYIERLIWNLKLFPPV